MAKVIPLQRVFHSIRFKVNKVGVQRYSFFCIHTVNIPFPFIKKLLGERIKNLLVFQSVSFLIKIGTQTSVHIPINK